MALSVFPLPLPILLLVHLHILEYPLANKPEYDQHAFEPRVRGLRDRTKTMEDVCFYLVGEVERSRERAKAILPSYPCLQPTDTVAFRASLAKYLEGLRRDSIRPSSQSDSIGTGVAWWWKDVVVRKSLIEECAGERFERILVSLTTHALLRGALLPPRPVDLETSYKTLSRDALKYTAILASAQLTRSTWEHSASLLIQRQTDLRLLREHLTAPAEVASSKYASLSTERLLALAQARIEELQQDSWKGKEDQMALSKFTELAGLISRTSAMTPASPLSATMEAADGEQVHQETNTIPVAPITPQSLPVAAALHPSSLRKLRAPIFPTPGTSSANVTKAGVTPTSNAQAHAQVALSGERGAEERTQQILGDALVKAKRAGMELGEILKKLKGREDKTECSTDEFEIDLWERTVRSVDFKVKPISELISSLSLDISPYDSEAEIDHIRTSLLPPFPLPPALPTSPHPLPALDHSHTNIPIAPPATPRSLVTSTPPVSVKPRSKVMITQVKGSHVVGGGQRRKSRKSVRLSYAATRRPSLFPLSPTHDDEVNRIVDAVRDNSASFDRADPSLTPQPGTRITGYGALTVKKSARPSFKIHERTSLASLPDPIALDGMSSGEHPGDWTDDVASDDHDDAYEGKSMSLRDILLGVGETTECNLLGGSEVDLEGVDESFEWN